MKTLFLFSAAAPAAVVFLLLSLAASSGVFAAAPGTPDELFASVNFSGSASFFFSNDSPDKPLFSKNYGKFNPLYPSLPWPATASPAYPIASNTKVFVAVGLLLLQQRGVLKLTDDIADHLSPSDLSALGLKNATRYCPVTKGSTTCQIITFRNLLSMNAGIQDDWNNQFLPFPGTTAGVVARYDIVNILFQPGAKYYYSNPAFMFAAFFVEKYNHMTFQQFVERAVTRKLGMRDTYMDFFDNQLNANPNRCPETYHFLDHDNREGVLGVGSAHLEFSAGSANGAGGIISTQRDERVMWTRGLFNFNSEKKYLSTLGLTLESITELITPYTFISDLGDNISMNYALGMFVNTVAAGSERAQQVRRAGVPATHPQQIIQAAYEGEIMDSHTSNFLDFTIQNTQGGFAMGQVWSTQRVFYPTKTQFADARTLSGPAAGQSFFGIVNNWPQQPSLGTLAQQLIKLLS